MLNLLLVPFFLLFITYAMYTVHKRGWNNLQERYEYNKEFEGEKVKVRYVYIDGMSSKNIVKIKISPMGVYLYCPFPFNTFSKPVLIPWTEVVDVQDKKVPFQSIKRLVIGKQFASTIDFYEKDFNKINMYL